MVVRTAAQMQMDEGFGPAQGGMRRSLLRFDAAYFLGVLASRRNQFLGVLGGCVAATVVALFLIVPLYTATAELMIEVRRNNVAEVNSVLTVLPTDQASIQNQIQILTSRQFARRVIEKLSLHLDPEFGDGASASRVAALGEGVGGLQVPEKVVDTVLKRLRVTQSGLSTTLTISAGSRDALKSARIVNAWVDAYVEEQLSAKYDATRAAVTWLSGRVRELAEQAQADEAEVQRYKAENEIVELGASGSLVDQQAATVSLQLVNARADHAQKKSLYERVLVLQRTAGPVAASQVVDSPVLTELRNKEAELARQEAQLSSRYLPQHPRMLEIASQREANRERIRVEVQRGVERLASEVAVARANAESLQGSLTQVQSRFRTEGTASIKLKALRSIAESSRAQYEALLARLKAVQGQEAFATPDAQIVSRANVPLTPSPSRALVAGLALPMSILIALVAVFAAEGLQPVVRTGEQAREVLGLSVLAVTPSIGTVSRPALAAAAIDAPGKPFARSLHAALLGLGLAADDVEPKTILVASAKSGDGKTTTAVGLARVAARYGRRTLLIDANFLQPAVAHAMGLDPTAGGLGSFLTGGATLEASVCRDDQTDLRVLVPGIDEVAGVELTPARLKALLGEARQRFDLVIIDTASVQEGPDAVAMARLCDATVLVLHAGHTPRETAMSVIEAFMSARARLAGVVLAQARDVKGAW
jgi:capsular exopolysaccharide synthesis family protein